MKSAVKYIVMLIAVGFVISVVIESDGPETSATVTTTTASAAPETTTTTSPATTTTTEYELTEADWESVYLITVREQSLTYDDLLWVDLMDDDALVRWGHAFCDNLDPAHPEVVMLAAMQAVEDTYGDAVVDADYEMVGYAGGAAVEAFCPEHSASLLDFSEAWSA